MRDNPLPPRRYNTTDYPNCDPDALGRVIPIGYGTLAGVKVIEIDTATHRYKILDQTIAELTKVRSGTSALVDGTDYTKYLSMAEFRLHYNTRLTKDQTYYFAVSGTYPLSAAMYLTLGQNNGDYADGCSYSINGSSVWTPTSDDLRFKIYGVYCNPAAFVVDSSNNKIDFDEGGAQRTGTIEDGTYTGANLAVAVAAALNGAPMKSFTYTCTYSAVTNKFTIGAGSNFTLRWNTGTHKATDISDICGFSDATDDTGDDIYDSDYGEEVIAENTGSDATAGIALRDQAARTRIGQSFKSLVSYYPTAIQFYGWTKTEDPPVGELMVTFFAAINPDDPIAAFSEVIDVEDVEVTGDAYFDITGWDTNPEELTCDVKAPGTELTKVADILSDAVTNVMGKSASLLDSTELENLDTDRTQDLKILLREMTTFGDFAAKLEAGQLWKLIPKQDGTYLTIVPETGEPGNLLTLRDYDFLSFKMEIDNSEIKRAVTVFYDEDEATDDYPGANVSSQIARFFYGNEAELEVETYLKTLADADQLADDYLARYEVPIIRAIFEIHAKGIELLPFRDKVKLYRTRAAYTGGTLNGVLFRIIKLVKKPETNVVEITAAIWGNSAT